MTCWYPYDDSCFACVISRIVFPDITKTGPWAMKQNQSAVNNTSNAVGLPQRSGTSMAAHDTYLE